MTGMAGQSTLSGDTARPGFNTGESAGFEGVDMGASSVKTALYQSEGYKLNAVFIGPTRILLRL